MSVAVPAFPELPLGPSGVSGKKQQFSYLHKVYIVGYRRRHRRQCDILFLKSCLGASGTLRQHAADITTKASIPLTHMLTKVFIVISPLLYVECRSPRSAVHVLHKPGIRWQTKARESELCCDPQIILTTQFPGD